MSPGMAQPGPQPGGRPGVRARMRTRMRGHGTRPGLARRDVGSTPNPTSREVLDSLLLWSFPCKRQRAGVGLLIAPKLSRHVLEFSPGEREGCLFAPSGRG